MQTELTFHNPHALWLLLLVPLIAVWALVEGRSRAVLRFSAAHVFSAGPAGWRPRLLQALPLLRIAAIAAAVVALARPQARDARIRHPSVERRNILIAPRRSTSMATRRLSPCH